MRCERWPAGEGVAGRRLSSVDHPGHEAVEVLLELLEVASGFEFAADALFPAEFEVGGEAALALGGEGAVSGDEGLGLSPVETAHGEG